MTPIPDARRARRKWLLRLGLGLFILVVLIARGDMDALRRALAGVPWFVPPLAVMFYWLTQCLSAAKWRLLLRARGAKFSFMECARLYLLGMFWNLWMPTTIGGDAMRALSAGPRCGGVAAAASSILVERLTGLTALLTIGVIGVAVWGGGASSLGPAVLPRIIVVLLLAALVFLAGRALVYRLEHSAPPQLRQIFRKLASLLREIDFYARRERWSALAAAVAMSFIFHAMQITLNIYLARAAGLTTPTTVFLWLVPLLALMSMVPVSVGGLGVREVGAVAVLGATAPAATVVAWSLLWQATVWLSSLPGAIVAASPALRGD